MLQIIVFLCGAVLMSLEMVGSRLLAPTFGTSIYVWGSLIVVVMAALTLGYYYGGRIADQNPTYLMMGAILAIAGVFIGFLPFWTQAVNDFYSMFEPRIGSLLAALAFFFVPSVLLATISPYGIKLTSRSLTTIGNTAGYMAAISSAGSIIGTLLTSFFLIPAMGVRNIVHILGTILLLLSLLILFISQRHLKTETNDQNKSSIKFGKIIILFVLLSFIVLIFLWYGVPSRNNLDDNTKILYDRDSLYHHISVVQRDKIRHLHFDNSYQSAMDLNDPLEMVFLYTSYLHLGVVAHPQPSRVLFIGLGGGSAPKKFLHDYASIKGIDIVEIDPEVAKVARLYFNLPDDPRLRLIVQDGRLYIEKMAGEIAAGRAAPYDMVIIDAYSASSIPYHLTTREFIQAVRKTLSSDAVVVSNIIGAVTGPSSRLLRSMTRTVKAAFPQVYLFPVGEWYGREDTTERNIILVATMNSKHWDAVTWQEEAESLYKSGTITEDVPLFVGTLVDEDLIRENWWLTGMPLLTDDYAPVDTLQSLL